MASAKNSFTLQHPSERTSLTAMLLFSRVVISKFSFEQPSMHIGSEKLTYTDLLSSPPVTSVTLKVPFDADKSSILKLSKNTAVIDRLTEMFLKTKSFDRFLAAMTSSPFMLSVKGSPFTNVYIFLLSKSNTC